MSEKLRSLCVPSSGPAVPVRKDSRSFADVVKAKGDRLGDAIWAHFGGPELRHREEQLGGAWLVVGERMLLSFQICLRCGIGVLILGI